MQINNTISRGFQECCLSLAKQQPALSDPLCFCHSSQVGRKMKLLNQRLGRMPDFQTQAVKGPLCPLQSFTGTADSRSETAFQACLYQSNLLLCSGGTPGETSAPQLCWCEGAWLCALPASQTPGCQTFLLHRPALRQHQPTSACRTSDSWKSFDIQKNKTLFRGKN